MYHTVDRWRRRGTGVICTATCVYTIDCARATWCCARDRAMSGRRQNPIMHTACTYVGTTMSCAKNEHWLCECTPLGRIIERVRLYVPVPQVTLHDSQAFHCPTSLSEVFICSTHISSMPVSMQVPVLWFCPPGRVQAFSLSLKPLPVCELAHEP